MNRAWLYKSSFFGSSIEGQLLHKVHFQPAKYIEKNWESNSINFPSLFPSLAGEKVVLKYSFYVLREQHHLSAQAAGFVIRSAAGAPTNLRSCVRERVCVPPVSATEWTSEAVSCKLTFLAC